MMDKSKIFWNALLFLTVLLYLLALFKDILWLYFGVMLLAFFIYRNGQKHLFKEYDEKRRKKQEDFEKLINHNKE